MDPSRRRGPASVRVASLAVAIALACAAVPMAAQSQKGKIPTYSVSDASSFLKMVGPNRTLVLKKGDYKLASAYSVSNEYVTWSEYEEGKELALTGLANLTIRGAEGARIVCDSPDVYILGIYAGKNIAIDNLRFVRSLPEGVAANAGGIYAEDTENLTFDRCSFEGPSNSGLELWQCEGASVKRCEITGARSAAVTAFFSSGLAIASSVIRDCEGYPLLDIQECDPVLVSDTKIESNSGGDLIDIFAEIGFVDSVGFLDCQFIGNDFSYFSGASILPHTTNCSFDGNSFGEDWAESAVAPSEEDYGYGDEPYAEGEYGEGYEDYGEYEEYGDFEEGYEDLSGPQRYAHLASGLFFDYPSSWELERTDDESRVAVFAPSGESVVLLIKAYAFPEGTGPAELGLSLFSEANEALADLLAEETGVALDVASADDPFEEMGLLMAEYRGVATKGDGEKAAARVRFAVAGDLVYAFVALCRDEGSLDEYGDVDLLMKSIGMAQG